LHALVQLDNLSPPNGGTFQGNSITDGAFQTLVAGFLGTTQTATGTAQVVTGARDCASHELLGGMIDLVDDATGQPLPVGAGPGDLHSAYFGSDDLPHTECVHTVALPIALWAAINVPTDRKLRIRLSGRMRETDAQPVVLGERALELVPDTILIERAYRLTP